MIEDAAQVAIPSKAALPLVGLLLLGLGSLVASAAFGRRGSETSREDAEPDMTAAQQETQGGQIPLVLGTRQVGGVKVLVEDPNDRKAIPITEDVPSSGGGLFGGIFGGGGTNRTITGHQYRQYEADAVCVGCDASGYMELTRIRDTGGNRIWTGDINTNNTASGTTIQTDKHGPFTIWWGHRTQGQDAVVRDLMGFATRMPGVVLIVWKRARTGTDPRSIPKLYTVGVYPDTSGLGSASEAGAATIGTGLQQGMNPAHLLYLLHTAAYPLGGNGNCDWIDRTTLRLRGLEAESENIAMNLLIGGRGEEPTVGAQVEAILRDMSWTRGLSPDGRLTFLSRRDPTSTVPTLGDDVAEGHAHRSIQGEEGAEANEVVYTIDDVTRRYLTTPIKEKSAGEIERGGRVKRTERKITTATHPGSAKKIANRRAPEDLADTEPVQVAAGRGASLLTPGQQFKLSDGKTFTALGITDVESGAVRIDGVLDSLGIPTIDDDFGTIQTFGTGDPVADRAFTFFEVPTSLQEGATPEIAVFRARGGEFITGAEVHISADAGDYTLAGTQDIAAVGASLETPLLSSTGDTVASGITIEPFNDDIAELPDLTNAQTEYENGRLLWACNGEVGYVQSVSAQSETAWSSSAPINAGDIRVPTTGGTLRFEALNGGTTGSDEPSWSTVVGGQTPDNGIVWQARNLSYELSNLLRAQWDTTKLDHAVGSTFYLIDSMKLERIAYAGIQDGVTLCVKTRPFSGFDGFDLGEIDEQCKLIGSANLTDGLGNNLIDDLSNNLTA